MSDDDWRNRPATTPQGGQEARSGVETGNPAPEASQPRRTAQRVETLDITKERADDA